MVRSSKILLFYNLFMADGILLIDKPAGLTSRQVDNKIQKVFHTRKVGHLGTLDPFATGLLIVGVNKGNKALPFLDDSKKTYFASLKLGVKTDTGDLDGKVIEEAEIPMMRAEEVERALSSFLGKSMQVPPMTSAIKKDGTALYELAHQGKEIEREPREIEVFDIFASYISGDRIDFYVTVSKGTYIRTLGEDLAKRLHTVGHLVALRRMQVGDVHVNKAVSLEAFTESDLIDAASLIPLPKVELTEAETEKAKNGVRLSLANKEKEVLLIHKGQAIAIYEKNGSVYCAKRGLF